MGPSLAKWHFVKLFRYCGMSGSGKLVESYVLDSARLMYVNPGAIVLTKVSSPCLNDSVE